MKKQLNATGNKTWVYLEDQPGLRHLSLFFKGPKRAFSWFNWQIFIFVAQLSIWKKRPSLTQGQIDGEEKSSEQDPKRVLQIGFFGHFFVRIFQKHVLHIALLGPPQPFLEFIHFSKKSRFVGSKLSFEIHPDEAEFHERYPP